jgi:hypothetical protein
MIGPCHVTSTSFAIIAATPCHTSALNTIIADVHSIVSDKMASRRCQPKVEAPLLKLQHASLYNSSHRRSVNIDIV